jgi:glutamyl-Q tRNA(Asp) synthetase
VGYVGRFAPSPTGPLHLGSLVTAVASFLHARQSGGEWLVRIEDIDPPREAPGAAADILRTLEALDLEWDRPVLFQSSRFPIYREAAQRLLASGAAFRCTCSRSSIRATEATPGRYAGTCREKGISNGETAVRVRVEEPAAIRFLDGVQGEQIVRLDQTTGDYVVLRRDGLPAYHLAVVIDDAFQGVTSVVRGVDLLDSTAAHIHLQRTLGAPTPAYWHVPVVVNAGGQKLSKQTGATPVASRDAAAVAVSVLALLGSEVPAELRGEPPRILWRWAQGEWRIDSLRGKRALADPLRE